MGFGLLGISIANLIAPFIGRYLSYKFFLHLVFVMNYLNIM